MSSNRKKTAAELRAAAEKLVRAADAMEAARAERIGRFLMHLETQGWADVTLDSVKSGVAKC